MNPTRALLHPASRLHEGGLMFGVGIGFYIVVGCVAMAIGAAVGMIAATVHRRLTEP